MLYKALNSHTSFCEPRHNWPVHAAGLAIWASGKKLKHQHKTSAIFTSTNTNSKLDNQAVDILRNMTERNSQLFLVLLRFSLKLSKCSSICSRVSWASLLLELLKLQKMNTNIFETTLCCIFGCVDIYT